MDVVDMTSIENGTSAYCVMILTCVATAIGQERRAQANTVPSTPCSASTLVRL